MKHKQFKLCKVRTSLDYKKITFLIILASIAGAVRLEGDVITANGSILSGSLGHRYHIDQNIVNCPQLQISDGNSIEGDRSSMCSCSCGCFRASRQRQ
jgi:hypothetical protein